jgi:hypothetical protein
LQLPTAIADFSYEFYSTPGYLLHSPNTLASRPQEVCYSQKVKPFLCTGEYFVPSKAVPTI